MTKKEFQKHQENKDMPRFSIGQGFGYKLIFQDWDSIPMDDIIYIPEYAYAESTSERFLYDESNAYTKADFISLCGNDEQRGRLLFEIVDWQFPTSLIDEGFLDD